MNLIYFILGIMFLAGLMFAISSAVTRPRRIIDKDSDGAQDEPNGPAKDP